MRIVISTQGSLGDLLPYLGIGAELQRRGHSVVLGTANQFRGRVEAAGLEHRPVRPHLSLGEPRWAHMLRSGNGGLERFLAEVVAPALPDHHADTEKLLADADLVVTHPMSLGAAIVAEQRGLPRVATVLSPWLFVSAHEPARFAGHPVVSSLYTHAPWARPALRSAVLARTRKSAQPIIRLRERLGLPADVNPLYDGLFAAECVLGLFSPLLGAPQPDWPAGIRVTGFCAPPQDADAALPERLAEFLGRGPAPAVFTLGSSYAHDPGDFYVESLAAARECGLRSVLLAPSGVPADLGPDVHVEPYADHRALFPRAAVVVCSAGIGSIAAAMAGGRPFIAVPDGVDQPDNAYRCRRLGLCTVVPRPRYRRRRVARLLAGGLADPAFAARSERVVQCLAAERGVQGACDAIDALAAGATGGELDPGSRTT